jgi:SOS response regulatory protein OraA/RecX
MPKVTALRPVRPGRVLVELDGRDWRVVPAEAVARAGLREGLELDRPSLRALRRELERARALEAAGRALRARELSRRELEERLERGRIAPAAQAEAIDVLERLGLLDEGRFADGRARALAERGLGDAAIRSELERQGIEAEPAEQALAALEPEAERARRLAVSLGGGVRSVRALRRKGFGEDAIEAAVPSAVAEDG